MEKQSTVVGIPVGDSVGNKKEPVRLFDEVNHIHTLDGKPLMGVTTVLKVIGKPALVPWAAKQVVEYIEKNCDFHKSDDGEQHGFFMVTEDKLKLAKVAHTKKKDDAADWGTIVHKAIEQWIASRIVSDWVMIMDKNIEVLPEHRVAIENFISWATTNNAIFLGSEVLVHSEQWWVGGICDFVCRIGDKLVIGDIKTSSGIWEEYWIQVAAYAKMMMEMGLYEHFDEMTIINCKKDGKVKVETRTNISENIKAFEGALVLHKHFNQ